VKDRIEAGYVGTSEKKQVESKPVGEIIKWVDELDARHLLEY
jgi:hypothetical protein